MGDNLYADLEEFSSGQKFDNEGAHIVTHTQTQAVNSNAELDSFLRNAFENEFADAPVPATAAADSDDSDDDDDDDKAHVEMSE